MVADMQVGGKCGKFIAIEGIDGSGKATQLELLGKGLDAHGLAHVRVSFPRYESSFGRLVAGYLNGDFGPLEAVDPRLSALLYAGDRFEAKPELEAALAAGKTLLSDRYIASNLAHQTARVAPDKRAEFLAWLRQLEYGIYSLPAEDLVIYLRLPASQAQELVARKAARNYTAKRRDLQEADVRHLEAAAAVYDQLAQQPNWRTIECLGADGALRTPDAIAREVWAAAEPLLVLGAAARK
jgi:dTMP kinase